MLGSNSVLLQFQLKTEFSVQGLPGTAMGAMGPRHAGAHGSTQSLWIPKTSSHICYLRNARFTILSNQAVRKHEKEGLFFFFFFFFSICKTTPLSLKWCQKAYPNFPQPYSSHSHLCAVYKWHNVSSGNYLRIYSPGEFPGNRSSAQPRPDQSKEELGTGIPTTLF